MDVTDLDADTLRQLATWLDTARTAGQPMPVAVTIASATSDAVPSARLAMLRGLRRGLVFFTDCRSDKGAELAANPRAAAVLHWLVPAHRQVRVAGLVERVSQDEADEYWSTPPRRPPRAKAAPSPAGRSWKRRSRTCCGATRLAGARNARSGARPAVMSADHHGGANAARSGANVRPRPIPAPIAA